MTERLRWDSGISTIEALVAVAIVSLSVAALVSGSFSALTAARKARTASIKAIAILRADQVLRDSIGRVRIPFWSRTTRPDVQSASLSLPWFDGNKERALKASIRDSVLVVESSDEGGEQTIASIAGFDEATFTFVERDDGFPVAVDVRYRIRGTESRTLAPLGAMPLERESP